MEAKEPDASCDPASPPEHMFGYLPTENKYFRIVACYQEYEHHCQNWDPVYCTSLLMYCTLAVINICLISYVLHFYRKSLLGESVFSKLKSWILIMCIVLYIIEFIRNFWSFNNGWKYSLALLYVEQISRLLVYVLICHYFLKAAANLVGKQTITTWRRRLNNFLYAVLAFLALLLIWYILNTFNVINKNKEQRKPCKTFEFMIQESLLLIIMIGFAYSGKVIEKQIAYETEALQ
jgi:hypothetical protein